MLLNWKNGKCTNPPKSTEVEVQNDDDTRRNGWMFSAVQDAFVVGKRDLPTERSAQLACEAALIRLGVVPLPAWSESGRAWQMGDNHVGAVVMLNGKLWEATVYCGGVSDTMFRPSADEATAAAERHLRAELAAWLDALAAKEGVM